MADEVRREWFDKDYYQVLGVPKNALAGGDQEGVPQARAAVPPGREPRQQGRGGAVQGDLGRQRRPVGDEEKRKSYDQVREMGAAGYGPGGVRAPAAPDGRAAPAVRAACGTRPPTSTSAICCAGSATRGPRRGSANSGRSAAPTSRPTVRDLVRRGDVRDDRAGAHHGPGRVSHVSRERRGAGHEPDHVSHVRWLGLGQREPGVLLDGAAVPGVPRERPHHRAPVSRRATGQGRSAARASSR